MYLTKLVSCDLISSAELVNTDENDKLRYISSQASGIILL